LLGGSCRCERNDCGFVFVLGPVSEPTQTVEIESPFQAVDTEVPVVTTIDYASLDYAQIVNRVREDIRDEEEDWLRTEIDRVMGAVEAANVREIQRVRAELQYLSALQRVAQKDYLQNASSIQLLAQRTERE